MIDQSSLAMFIAASTALAFAPGPDNIFVLAQSISMGRTAGFIITLGLCTGLLVHTAVVALGIAAIFQTSVLAFNVLKYIGAAYLLYLAWKAFTARGSGIRPDGEPRLSRASLYRRGIIMNVTNPKVSLFFLAFLPQFIRPGTTDKTSAFLLLGAAFVVQSLLFLLLVVAAVARLRRWPSSPRVARWLQGCGALLFAALALRLAATRQPVA